MSSFSILEWRYIALTEEQRAKLSKVDVQKMAASWEEEGLRPADKVWLLKQEILVSTYREQTVDLERTVLDIPRGMMCVHTPPRAQNLLRETNVALGLLFEYLKLHKLQSNPQTRLTIFDRFPPHSRIPKPKELRRWLRSHQQFEVIDRFWSVYMKILAEHFDRSEDELICDHCDMSIIKYDERAHFNGFFMHIDNVLRCDATVFSVGVGRDVVYDMTRVFGRKKDDEVCIVRSSNPEGTMMVLDGEARYKWAHSVPAYDTHNSVKYTMVLRLPGTAGVLRRIGKCSEFNTDMYSLASSTEPDNKKTPGNLEIGAQHDSLLGLLTQLESTCIDTHIPDRIKRPGLPHVHPRPGCL
jgi:hypothetical protein